MRAENIQDVLDQIPIRHDIASYIMFLGIVLGLLVGILILIKTNKKKRSVQIFRCFSDRASHYITRQFFMLYRSDEICYRV